MIIQYYKLGSYYIDIKKPLKFAPEWVEYLIKEKLLCVNESEAHKAFTLYDDYGKLIVESDEGGILIKVTHYFDAFSKISIIPLYYIIEDNTGTFEL